MLERYIGSRAFEDYADQLSVYAVHPGNITTAGSIGAMQGLGLDPETTPMPDSLELAAATFLWLTARNAEWLSGRSVSLSCMRSWSYSFTATSRRRGISTRLWKRRRKSCGIIYSSRSSRAPESSLRDSVRCHRSTALSMATSFK